IAIIALLLLPTSRTRAQSPTAPTNLVARAGSGAIGLSWIGMPGASYYNVYRGTAAGKEDPTPVKKVAGAAYVDGGLTNGTTYYYRVTAVSLTGESGLTN